jgi:hypothetical protein
MWDLHIDRAEAKLIATLTRGNLFLAIANAISGLIQLSKGKLDVYHADIILLLGILLYGPVLFTRTVAPKRNQPGAGAQDPVIHTHEFSFLSALARLAHVALTAGIIKVHFHDICGTHGCGLLFHRALAPLGLVSMAIHLLAFIWCFYDLVASPFQCYVERHVFSEPLMRFNIRANHIKLKAATLGADARVGVESLACWKRNSALITTVILGLRVELLIFDSVRDGLVVDDEENKWEFGQVVSMILIGSQTWDIVVLMWQKIQEVSVGCSDGLATYHMNSDQRIGARERARGMTTPPLYRKKRYAFIGPGINSDNICHCGRTRQVGRPASPNCRTET